MYHSLTRRACAALLLAAFTLGICPVPFINGARAQEAENFDQVVVAGSTVFALATNTGLNPGPQRLVSFESNTPGTLRSDTALQGLQPGETLKGLDFRPANGVLYGLGSSGRLYSVNFANGVASQVGTGTFNPAISSVDFFGFDFNPQVDRLRVVSAVSNQNLRVDPREGATAGTVIDFDPNTTGTQPDTPLAYAATDTNTGDEPNVVGAAYTNNFAGATSTVLYGIDARASGGNARLVTIGGANGTPSPNGGQLFTVANVTNPAGANVETNNLVGFDISSDGNAYATFTPINPFDAPSSFYTLNLTTGGATLVDVIGADSTATGGLKVEGIAVVTTAANQTNSTFQVSATTATVNEGAGSITITVTRTGTTTGAANVSYTTIEGTASQRMDFITAAGTLFFAAGEAQRTVTVLITNDVFAEAAETFTFALANPQGGTIGAGGRTATITIVDNETVTATTNPIDEAEFFVRQQYRDFLNREADTPGLNFWTGQYNTRVGTCNTTTTAGTQQRINCVAAQRASISLGFFLSVEFQRTGYTVYRAYDVAFARLGATRPARGAAVSAVAVTYDEFIRDTQTIARDIIVNNAVNAERVEANTVTFLREFVQRPEFTDRFPVEQSAEQYVDALFASANITPTAAERTATLTAFGGGGINGRAAALRAVIDNDQVFQREFNRAFVLLEYIGYLRRDPDLAGYNFWLNKLDSASTATRIDPANVPLDAEAIRRIGRAEIIESFIRSCEYQRRFGPPTTSPNDLSVSSQCGS